MAGAQVQTLVRELKSCNRVVQPGKQTETIKGQITQF